MAVCEGQLESGLARLNREGSDETRQEPALPTGLPLTVDYRSPLSHFVPPHVELYAARHKQGAGSSAESPEGSPVKRKRGRPRVDKTSPEYLANVAARKQAREMAAMARGGAAPPEGKRKRGRPRLDKTSPEYLARKRARELEALERKAKREYKRRSTAAIAPTKTKPSATKQSFNNKKATRKKLPLQNKVQRKLPPKANKVAPSRKVVAKKIAMRRNTKFVKRKDSGASSSTGDATPRVKRKYTKRAPHAANAKKNDGGVPSERVRKRGRPRKDQLNTNRQQLPPKIRVRNNLMPVNNEPISLDSDDEPDLGSPGAASDSLSLDENLRALRHIHEKYANIDKDDLYSAHLLAANFKKPAPGGTDDDVLSVRSDDGGASVKELDTRVEKLEDSSGSDSDSTSSGSDSSSSGSSSSSSGSSSSSSSDSEPEDSHQNNHTDQNTYPSTPWEPPAESDSDPERGGEAPPPVTDDISESDNESPDKSFQCHICRKWYSTRVTLKIHRRSHQNRGGGASRARSRASDRYACDICPAAFPRREKLYLHKSECHRGSMTFRCEVCGRCFEHDDELGVHSALHTDDDRNGRCTDCHQTFDSYAQLSSHRAHAHAHAQQDANAAHSCAHCGKRFTHVHSLTRHLHNHAKQLYRCVVCKASFARADQLAQHLNSHLANYKRLKP